MIFTSDLLLISFDHLKMQKPFLDCGPHRPRRRAVGHTGRRPRPLTWHKLLETGRGVVTARERQRLRRARRPFLALNSQSVKERHPVCYFNSPLSWGDRGGRGASEAGISTAPEGPNQARDRMRTFPRSSASPCAGRGMGAGTRGAFGGQGCSGAASSLSVWWDATEFFKQVVLLSGAGRETRHSGEASEG